MLPVRIFFFFFFAPAKTVVLLKPTVFAAQAAARDGGVSPACERGAGRVAVAQPSTVHPAGPAASAPECLQSRPGGRRPSEGGLPRIRGSGTAPPWNTGHGAQTCSPQAV